MQTVEPKPTDAAITPAARKALAAICAAIAEHGETPPESFGLPPGVQAVKRSLILDSYEKLRTDIRSRKKARDALWAPLCQLQASAVIHASSGYVWRTGRNVRGFDTAA